MSVISITLTQDELVDAVAAWVNAKGYAPESVILFHTPGDRPGEADSFGATAVGCQPPIKAKVGRCPVCGDDPNGKRQPCAASAQGSTLCCPRPPQKPTR